MSEQLSSPVRYADVYIDKSVQFIEYPHREAEYPSSKSRIIKFDVVPSDETLARLAWDIKLFPCHPTTPKLRAVDRVRTIAVWCGEPSDYLARMKNAK